MERIAIIGGGINGLVAANYLARGGADVSLHERRERIGGACVSESITLDGVDYEFPLGATVLGFMQDFVFEETGLSTRLETWAPPHAKVVYYPGASEPVYIHRDPEALERELRAKCGEQGDVAAFRTDEARVVAFLRDGYRKARSPRLEDARDELGSELTERFIEGTARSLLEHYFTSERTKLYMAMTVIESGPVSLDAPFSAFNVPLLNSGSVFDGYYGFVKGVLWKLTEELARINAELGVGIETSSPIASVDDVDADRIVLATDPVTAASLCGEPAPEKHYLGTSGKLTLLFRHPVTWKDAPEADTAFRFIFLNDSLDAMERAAQHVVGVVSDRVRAGLHPALLRRRRHASAGSRRALRARHRVLQERAFRKARSRAPGCRTLRQRRGAREDRESRRSSLVAHVDPSRSRGAILVPGGQRRSHNDDRRAELLSPALFAESGGELLPFGANANIYYCGAAGYPCGSIAGTTGYMCAQQILRTL